MPRLAMRTNFFFLQLPHSWIAIFQQVCGVRANDAQLGKCPITPFAWPVPSIDPGADDKDGAVSGMAAPGTLPSIADYGFVVLGHLRGAHPSTHRTAANSHNTTTTPGLLMLRRPLELRMTSTFVERTLDGRVSP